MRSLWLMMAAVLAMGLQPVFAEEPAPMTPIMFSLFNPAQIPAENYDVNGLRIDLLYGKCRNLRGLDVGLVNHATGREIGLEAGLVNYVEQNFTGLQVGAVNLADRMTGFQVGVFNGADDVSGIQIGVINDTRIMRGLQLGLINVIENNDIAFFPVFNCFF